MTANPLWYLTRGSGVVALLLLTGTMLLGIASSGRAGGVRWPRFVIAGLHRNLTLLAILFVGVHVVTTVVDGYAPITLVDAVVPFRSPYRSLWLGFGAVAFDLLLCLTLSSLLRRHIGQRAWRALHWLAYGTWPIAVVHGLGTGTDAATRWLLALTVAAVTAVAVALLWRLAHDWRERSALRAAAAVTTLALPLAGGAWYRSGPLEPGWAAASGTPRTLLRSARPTQPSLPALPFAATVAGTVTQGQTADGGASLAIHAVAGDGIDASVAVTLEGSRTGDGTLQVSSGRVVLGPSAAPALYAGAVTSLSGGRIEARVQPGSDVAAALSLSLALQAEGAGRSVTGTLEVRRSTS